MTMPSIPEAATVYLPRGSKHAILKACRHHGITQSDWLRECIALGLQLDGVDVPDELNAIRPHLAHGPADDDATP